MVKEELFWNGIIVFIVVVVVVLTIIHAFSHGESEVETREKGAMLFCECMGEKYEFSSNGNVFFTYKESPEAEVRCTSEDVVSIYTGEFKEEPSEWAGELVSTFHRKNISSYSYDIDENSNELTLKCNGEVVATGSVNSTFKEVLGYVKN